MPVQSRILLLLGASALLASAFWTLEHRAEGNYPAAPAALDYSLRSLFYVGLALTALAVWRWRHNPTTEASHASEVPDSSTVFRPQFTWILELFVWALPPVIVFTVLVIATQLDLPLVAAVLLLLVMLPAWPMFLAISMTTYEITPATLEARSFLFRQSIPWAETTAVRAVHPPFGGEQLEFHKTAGRPGRVVTPHDRDRFLAEVRRHAPEAQIDV